MVAPILSLIFRVLIKTVDQIKMSKTCNCNENFHLHISHFDFENTLKNFILIVKVYSFAN